MSSQIQIQLQLKIQIQIQTHRYKAYFLTVEMMQWQLKRLVVLELWRTHTKLLGLPHFRKILDFFALFSAAFNHIPFPGKGPSLECLLPAIFRGCNYVRWVERGGMGGTRAGGCLWGLLLMAACPQLLLSHDFHSSCSGHQEPHLLPHRPPAQGTPKSSVPTWRR